MKGTIRAIDYCAPRGCYLAERAHAIGVFDIDSLRAIEALGSIEALDAVKVSAERGRLDHALPLMLLADVPSVVVGRGARKLAAELARRWHRISPELHEAVQAASLLERTRARVAVGAYAWSAGDALRRALMHAVGPLMTKAQAPDLIERIEMLGRVEDPS